MTRQGSIKQAFMTFDIALTVLLMFSAACYFALGLRLVAARREVGTTPIGMLFVVAGIWVLGGAVELLSTDGPLLAAVVPEYSAPFGRPVVIWDAGRNTGKSTGINQHGPIHLETISKLGFVISA